MSARIRWALDYVQYVRERGYLLEVGRFVLSTQRQRLTAEKNAFGLGRSYQLGKSLQWPMVREVLQPLADASRVEPPERGGL